MEFRLNTGDIYEIYSKKKKNGAYTARSQPWKLSQGRPHYVIAIENTEERDNYDVEKSMNRALLHNVFAFFFLKGWCIVYLIFLME